MKIDSEKWLELRQAVALDDPEQFYKLVWEFAHQAVDEERVHRRVCDDVRSRERGVQPYFAFNR